MPYYDSFYRVSYGDTDQMGVVYYGNYLEIFERARTEMFRSIGLPYAELEKKGFMLPVRTAELTYHASAHYDDYLTLRCWVQEAHGAKLVIASQVLRDETLLVSGKVTLCCVSQAGRVTRLPEFLLEAARKFAWDQEPGK